ALGGVTSADPGDRRASGGLAGDVADHQTVRRTGKAAVSNERHRIAQAFAGEGAGHAEHLAHPGAADRTFVANHDDIAGLDLPRAHRFKGSLLTVEDARRSPMQESLVTGEFYHATFGRQVATKDGKATGRLQRLR